MHIIFKHTHTLGYTPKGEDDMRWNEIMSCYVMLCYHVMSAWVVYGLATWPCPKLEIRRYVYSSHHWPLRWPSTNDERDGPLLLPFDSGFFYTDTSYATLSSWSPGFQALAPKALAVLQVGGRCGGKLWEHRPIETRLAGGRRGGERLGVFNTRSWVISDKTMVMIKRVEQWSRTYNEKNCVSVMANKG